MHHFDAETGAPHFEKNEIGAKIKLDKGDFLS
jgi:hypothetical protein